MPSPRIRASVCLAVLLLLSACASAGQRFDGAWSYRQSCGFEHSATVLLKQQGSSLTGDWSDGTRVVGDSGQLTGEARGDSARVRFCSDGGANGSNATCPQFGDAADTFARVGDTLVWSRRTGARNRPYVTLHRADSGTSIPVDDQCDDDALSDDANANTGAKS